MAARLAHNQEVGGSNPSPAPKLIVEAFSCATGLGIITGYCRLNIEADVG